MTIKELAQKFGGPDLIPNEDLYDFLREKNTREDLARLVKPYKDKLREIEDAKDIKKKGVVVETREQQQEVLGREAAIELEKFKQHPFVASVRARCKKDLTWLTCFWCWETNPEGEGQPISENKITYDSHGPVLDLFVKKDDTKKIKDQDRRKIRMLLWPRGGMKSTIDVVDSVQWILNFPAIRILYLTGDDDLAQGFVKETKGHFLEHPDEPTLMNLFFPEFCFAESKVGNVYEFNSPVWLAKKVYRKEPTVQASSVGSGLGGRHYEVVKADDSVYDGNTGTAEVCQKVSKKISTTVRPGKALRFYGYLDIVGTRYHDVDYYGEVIEKHKQGGDLATVDGRCWTRTENPVTGEVILIGRAIVIKPDVAAKLEKEGRAVTYTEAGPDGCDLLLPEVMPYSSLIQEWMNNEDTFEGQMNQNPRTLSRIIFDRVLLLKSTVNFEEAPFSGPISQTWDFAGPFNSTKRGERDFCTASAAIWTDKGDCFIQEIARKRYKPNDLAKAVVAFAKKYHPFVVGIEDTGGAKFLEREIQHYAAETSDDHVIQVLNRIDWITPSNRVDAKEIRMAALHPWLVQGKMKFLNHCMAQAGGMDVLYTEFERCLVQKSAHNDVPDVLSYQPRYAIKVMGMASKPETSSRAFLVAPDQAAFNMMFADGDQFGRVGLGITPPQPIVAPEPEPEYHVPDMYMGVPNVVGL